MFYLQSVIQNIFIFISPESMPQQKKQLRPLTKLVFFSCLTAKSVHCPLKIMWCHSHLSLLRLVSRSLTTVWQSLAVVVLVSAAEASPVGFWVHCTTLTYLLNYLLNGLHGLYSPNSDESNRFAKQTHGARYAKYWHVESLRYCQSLKYKLRYRGIADITKSHTTACKTESVAHH